MRTTNGSPSAYIFLSNPARHGSHDEFTCDYGINIDGHEDKRTAHGVDGIQALYLAMRSLDGLIRRFNAAGKDKISWEGGMTGDDFGLPSYAPD